MTGSTPSSTVPAVAGRCAKALLVAAAVVFTLTASASGQSKPPPTPPASQPAEAADVDSALRRLRARPSEERSRKDLALQTGLEFCMAVAKPDGARAAELLTVVGYQALPREGELPEKPARPIDRPTFQKWVDGRKPARVGALAIENFDLLDHEALRPRFPAVARWMSAQDFALLIEPPADETPNWVNRTCCVVVRLRGRKAVVVGGNLLAALQVDAEGRTDS